MYYLFLFALLCSITPAVEPEADRLHQLATVMNHLKHTYIEPLSDNVIAEKAIRGLLNQLDPHSDYLDKASYKRFQEDSDGGFVGIGMEVTIEKGFLKVITPIDGSPAAQSGMKPGDIITHVDGVLVTDIGYEEAIRLIKGKIGTVVQLTILRKTDNQPLHLSVKRDKITVDPVSSKILASDIGYLKISTFNDGVAQASQQHIKKLFQTTKQPIKGFILDLRNNPGGLLDASCDVTNLFLDTNNLDGNKAIVVASDRTFKNQKKTYYAHGDDILQGLPMIVLINNGSASGSEILALCLQDYGRAIVMGEQSFGKGSIQTIIPIDSDSAIKITTGLYYSPKGRLIQGLGVTPDVDIPAVSLEKLEAPLKISESSYSNALPNEQNLSYKPQTQKYKDFLDNLEVLHNSDFQVYQAVLMLESLPSTT